MSFCTSARTLPHRFRLVLASFLQTPGLPFGEVLSEEEIQAAFDEEGVAFGGDEDAVYTPAVTLWAFLSQVLFKDEQRSCTAAVARVVVLMAALGRRVSDNTGIYCRARAKLSDVVIQRLALTLARRCEHRVRPSWLWHGRYVLLADGATISMPDTEANQNEWPQHGAQRKGLGFPIARMVVLLSLATAMVCGMAMGPYMGKETGELALLRQLLEHLTPGSVLLADRYYCSYFMICLLVERGVDVTVRLHHKRNVDFRRGQRLGPRDHLVTWPRPEKPEWMDQDTYDRMPESIEVRELHVHVHQPGFRTESLVVVTTLTDSSEYTKEDLAELYHKRWLAELDIRAIKISVGMDVLRCKSPAMVRNEVWTCLLAYNLIRKVNLDAAAGSNLSPREISFTASMQKVGAGWTVQPLLDDGTQSQVVDVHLCHLPGHRVGDRPDRIEPRAIKRRPKPHKLLTIPRAQARKALLVGDA